MFEVILIILGLFVVALFLKSFLSQLCAICFAVSLTWLYGLYMGWNPVILATLMGGSAVGFMYYLGSRLPENLFVFKLPYLVTALVLIWFILGNGLETRLLLALVGVWFVFVGIYLARHGVGKHWFKKVVECCKNW